MAKLVSPAKQGRHSVLSYVTLGKVHFYTWVCCFCFLFC